MSPVLKASRPIVRAIQNVGVRRYGGQEVGFEIPRMSELPVPQGSWAEAQSKRNAKGNATLIVGVLSAVIASAHAWSTRFEPLEKSEFPYKG